MPTKHDVTCRTFIKGLRVAVPIVDSVRDQTRRERVTNAPHTHNARCAPICCARFEIEQQRVVRQPRRQADHRVARNVARAV